MIKIKLKQVEIIKKTMKQVMIIVIKNIKENNKDNNKSNDKRILVYSNKDYKVMII